MRETDLMREIGAMRVVHSSETPAVQVIVEDVADPVLVAATQNVAEESFRAHGISGRWSMAVAASDVRGHWDVAVRGPQGRHFFSFPASAEELPNRVSHYLDRLLDRLSS